MNIIRTYLSSSRISQPATLRGKAVQHLEKTSVSRLLPIFFGWKALLLVIAVASPGVGYDSSTKILFDAQRGAHDSWFAKVVEYVLLRLTRWDGIYFASAAANGQQVYEQEWAFSWALSRVNSMLARGAFPPSSRNGKECRLSTHLFSALLGPLPLSSIAKSALAGVVISHFSHLLAILAIYRLVYFLTPGSDLRKRQLGFATACLHVFSPAGIFLSAPYAEAPFALLNILGLLCYAQAIENRFSTFADAYQLDASFTLLSGLFFGLATTMRSNGILCGLIFAWDAIATLPRLGAVLSTRDGEAITRVLATLAAGVLVAAGFVLPQAVAFMEYCKDGATRPWCAAYPPSIYSFVQSEYWVVGFMRYWKMSNLPLFLLALPVGGAMLGAALLALRQPENLAKIVMGPKKEIRDQPFPPPPQVASKGEKVWAHCLPRFALGELALVGLTFTSFHVQIITRIASGYPVWYMIMAISICESQGWQEEEGSEGRQGQRGNDSTVQEGQTLSSLLGMERVKPDWVVRGMVVYAVVQAGLYASFLPPA
ncbi:ER membrane glycoprotein subunit of the GPI transamidase complex-like protein [Elasticomyces elasticus]|nr:ER membrane glycoprotein subunit of the GPI transamidase complex-like protein [Elasticomyces elasticus]KAK3639649.1 ER membrane glycoprotein subunit of the GPI transamidase complex-like protein [Elasticomyces elasticus]KAK4913427.1 ER membrane glycoprotein subunit of the GPI transamidase complex-like protein [Elasticomyces elasticus]KAK5761002.1 ER membrane glycoprotein subunit of the GPI transamidase complex-like protein [Elasticomyces elasticus]